MDRINLGVGEAAGTVGRQGERCALKGGATLAELHKAKGILGHAQSAQFTEQHEPLRHLRILELPTLGDDVPLNQIADRTALRWNGAPWASSGVSAALVRPMSRDQRKLTTAAVGSIVGMYSVVRQSGIPCATSRSLNSLRIAPKSSLSRPSSSIQLISSIMRLLSAADEI
jgi:hypothetical protein